MRVRSASRSPADRWCGQGGPDDQRGIGERRAVDIDHSLFLILQMIMRESGCRERRAKEDIEFLEQRAPLGRASRGNQLDRWSREPPPRLFLRPCLAPILPDNKG